MKYRQLVPPLTETKRSDSVVVVVGGSEGEGEGEFG